MNRQQKEEVISSLAESFKSSQATFLVNYHGLTVEGIQALRQLVRKNGGDVKVAKVTLMQRAVMGNSEVEALSPYMKGQLSLVFAFKEPPVMAKVLRDFAKGNEKFSFVIGTMESKLLQGKELDILASMPSREVLLARLCGVLQMPLVQFALIMKMPISKLASVLKQVAENKS